MQYNIIVCDILGRRRGNAVTEGRPWVYIVMYRGHFAGVLKL